MNGIKKLFVWLVLLSSQVALGIAYTVPDKAEKSTVLQTIIGQTNLYKTVVFTNDVTIDGSNNVTVSGTDELEVFAEINDKISIQAASVSGVTAGNFPTLDIATATPVQITGNVIIQGDLNLSASGATLEITGDLTVVGSVTIVAGATLTVSGDILFDGNRINPSTVAIAGRIVGSNFATDPSDPGVNNITMRNYRAAPLNASSVAISNSIIATGLIVIENNIAQDLGCGLDIQTTSGLTAPILKSDSGIYITNNTGGTPVGPGQPGVGIVGNDVHFSGMTEPVVIEATRGDIVFAKNLGGGINNGSNIGGAGVAVTFVTGQVVTGVRTQSGDIIFDENTGGDAETSTAGAGVFIATADTNYMVQTLGTGSVFFSNNIGGNGTNAVGTSGSGVEISGSGTGTNAISSATNIHFSNNTAGAGAGLSGSGVDVLNSTMLASDTIAFENNQGSTSSTAANAGGNGVRLNSSIAYTVESFHNVLFTNNQGGSSSGTGAGGNGVLIGSQATIQAVDDIVFEENQGANSTSGTDGNGVDNDGTITSKNNVLFINNVSAGTGEQVASSGMLNGGVIVQRGDNATVFASNMVIQGDLTVFGSVVVNDNVELRVRGDILFDGQDVTGNTVRISGDIVGPNFATDVTDAVTGIMRIQNYTAGLAIQIASTAHINVRDLRIHDCTSTAGIGVDANGIYYVNNMNVINCTASGRCVVVGANIIATGDIVFAQNTGGNSESVFLLSPCRVLARTGTLRMANNATGGGNGVVVDSPVFVEVLNFVVTDNSTTAAGNAGALLLSNNNPANSNMIIYNNFVIARNASVPGVGSNGAAFRAPTPSDPSAITATNVFFIHNTGIAEKNIRDENLTLTGYYDGGAFTLYEKADETF
ncbi:MAG: hypothetical protein CL947_00310 [Epsilonproteobacteria bacterium]|nr:hypothetical protein [Campylobacterota bacterium]|tara:strand:+ start:1073 stop:3703 length:2631 start_codon:yes stop_codon:yes gene_type:complete